MLKTFLVNGWGKAIKAKITEEGALHTIVHPHPPENETIYSLPFSQFFTDNGISTGSSDMRVNGSSTNQYFYISANTHYDIYIKTLAFEISDAGAEPNEFGNLNALTNGVRFYYDSKEIGEYTINDSLKSNYDFIKLSCGQPAFGTGTSAYRITNAIANSESFIPVLDLQKVFGLQWGLRLRKGTGDRLVFQIRDNVSNVDSFNITGYGIRI